MKLRFVFLFLACIALFAAGCNGDDKDSKGEDAPKKKLSKAEQAVADDRDIKEKSVKENTAAFKDDDKDVGACRNLAMSLIALSSPASSGDPDKPAAVPKDRDKNMKRAIDTLEECRDIAPKDRDVQQMLASSYMGTSQYEKASTLLERLASTSKGEERANAYYAWGLAASNAQQYDKAITAWRKFVSLVPAKDPRVSQIRQSIKALEAAKNQPKPAPAAEADSDDEKDSDKDSDKDE